MGNTHSSPAASCVDRNKLSKPRIGSHKRENSNKSPENSLRNVVGRPNSGTAHTEIQRGRNQNRAHTWRSVNEANGISRQTTLPRHDSKPRRASSVAAYTEQATPQSRYASRRNSMVTPIIRTSGSEYDNDVVPDVKQHWEMEQSQVNAESSIIRRRSQLFAAPPATASRRQNLSLANLPVPETRYSGLFALDLADMDNVKTPSGYSVLGGFKRGSLRIVNETTPAPLTPEVRSRRRNTSPGARSRNPNASSTSIPLVQPTPNVEIPSAGSLGYFDFTTDKQEPITCVDIPKLLSAEVRPHSVIASSTTGNAHEDQSANEKHPVVERSMDFRHFPLEEYNPYNNNNNNLEPSHQVKANSEAMTVGFEAPLPRITNAGQLQEFRRQQFVSESLALANPPIPLANNTVQRRLSNTSSIYSTAPSLALHTQHPPSKSTSEEAGGSPSRRPSVKAGIDSAYGSMKSWRSNSWKAWSKGSSSPTRSRSHSKARAKKVKSAETGQNNNTQQQTTVEPPLRSTDKYRLSATIEGPVVELPATTIRRKSSTAKLGEPYLSRKKSIGEKLRSAVSITDLRNAANVRQRKESDDLSVELWKEEVRQVNRQLRHSKSFDAGPPQRYRSISSVNLNQSHSQQSYSQWSERSHSAPSLQSTPQLHPSRSFSQLPKSHSKSHNIHEPNTTPADYYSRFSKRRETRMVVA